MTNDQYGKVRTQVVYPSIISWETARAPDVSFPAFRGNISSGKSEKRARLFCFDGHSTQLRLSTQHGQYPPSLVVFVFLFFNSPCGKDNTRFCVPDTTRRIARTGFAKHFPAMWQPVIVFASELADNKPPGGLINSQEKPGRFSPIRPLPMKLLTRTFVLTCATKTSPPILSAN